MRSVSSARGPGSASPDRLVSLVLLLRRHGRLSATTLARELEVSTRTVLRDIDSRERLVEISNSESALAMGAKLEQLYVSSGHKIRPVVEAILLHPDFYAPSAPLVSPPVVWTAALLRARGRTIETDAWAWRGSQCGQQLFYPPNVSGWNDQGWLDTATLKGRWGAAYEVLNASYANPSQPYSKTETPEEALAAALQFWGNPTISEETRAELLRYATAAIPAVVPEWQKSQIRAERQNGLRHLIATCPDAYLS